VCAFESVRWGEFYGVLALRIIWLWRASAYCSLDVLSLEVRCEDSILW
jgi:hypothetical protein